MNRSELGMLFLRIMVVNPYWKNFILTTLSLEETEADLMIFNFRYERTDLESTALHDAARLEKS